MEENGRRPGVSPDSSFEFQSFEYEKKPAEKTEKEDINSGERHHRRRRGKKQGDFASFGAPTKAIHNPVAEDFAEMLKEDAPEETLNDVAENVIPEQTPENTASEETGASEQLKFDFEADEAEDAEVSETEADETADGYTDGEENTETVPESFDAAVPVPESIPEENSDIAEETEMPETDDNEPEQNSESVAENESDLSFDETEEPAEHTDEPSPEDVLENAQVRGFGCEQYTEDDAQPSEEAEPEVPENEAEQVSDNFGIQERFDITFLEPVAEAEEEDAPAHEVDEELNEVVGEVAEEMSAYDDDTLIEESADESEDEYEYEEDGDEEEVSAAAHSFSEVPSLYDEENAESKADADDDSDKAVLEEASEEANNASDEPAEEPDMEGVDVGGIVDIWDNGEDRAEWMERERFLEHCRALTLPPLKTTKTERAPKRKRPVQNISSGYKYESEERLPFSKNSANIEDKNIYREREKAFCEKRSKVIGKRMRDKLNGKAIKIWAVAALMLIVLAIDCLNFISIGGKSFLDFDNIGVFLLAEIALLLIGMLINVDIICDGIAAIFKGSCIPETLTAIVSLAVVGYHAAFLFLGYPEETPIIIGSPAVMALLLASVYRYYMLRRDVKIFELTSSYRTYTTEVKMKDFRSTPECIEFEGYVSHDASLYKMNRISRIDGIYDMPVVRDTAFGAVKLVALVSVCAALVCGLVFGFIQRSIDAGLYSACIMAALSAPVSMFVSMYMPRIKSLEASASDGAAVIGLDDTGDAYETNVIMLDDSELFPADGLSPKIEVCNTPELENHLHRCASLFSRLGGTLGSLFADGGFEEHKEVTIREIAEHGIYAIVDGSDVIVGSEKYLNKYGVKVNRYDGEMTHETGVLYIADGGEFFCRIIMTFKPDVELCKRIAELRNTDSVVSLKSCNPCIDETLVFMTTELEPDLLKLIKYVAGDDVCPAETDREGAIVSATGAVGIFSALLEYKRQKKLLYLGSRFAGVSCIVGGAVALVVILGGKLLAPFAPLIVIAVHSVLSIIASLLGRFKVIDTKTVIKKK